MSIESLGEFDENFGLPFSESMPSAKTDYHETIFSQESCSRPFKKEAIVCSNLAGIEAKVQRSVGRKKEVAPMGVEGSVEAGGTVSWGGEKGVEISGYGKGEVHDDNGNYAKGEVRQDSDGKGSATVSGGHKERSKS
ncbi:MAG: hypothetical protein HY861_03590 [Chlamydiia bacterium]|nr:hypothetical protein [Chlamydiia bacterium]